MTTTIAHPAPLFWDIQAVLFDLDGTLIDSAPDLSAAANTVRAQHGLPALPVDLYRPVIGAGAPGILGVAFDIDAEHPDFDTLRGQFYAAYAQCLTQHTVVFAGVAALIDGLLSCGLLWGIVTNKSERFTLPMTAAIPLFASAGAIVSGDTTPYAKPHPLPLQEAARRLGVVPGRCIYVGDDARDIVAGRAAGMGTVAAGYGYLGQKSDISQWGAHAIIQSTEELLPLIAHKARSLA